MPTQTREHKLAAALASLRQARRDENKTLEDIAEKRLNELIEDFPQPRTMIGSETSCPR